MFHVTWIHWTHWTRIESNRRNHSRFYKTKSVSFLFCLLSIQYKYNSGILYGNTINRRRRIRKTNNIYLCKRLQFSFLFCFGFDFDFTLVHRDRYSICFLFFFFSIMCLHKIATFTKSNEKNEQSIYIRMCSMWFFFIFFLLFADSKTTKHMIMDGKFRNKQDHINRMQQLFSPWIL